MHEKKIEINGLRIRIDDVYFVFTMDECRELYEELSEIFAPKEQTFNLFGLEGALPDIEQPLIIERGGTGCECSAAVNTIGTGC